VQASDGTLARAANGYGQANTPIGYAADSIYWGIYDGDRRYYKALTSGGAVGNIVSYAPPGGDDFYWAGSALVGVGSSNYIVFGGDSGKIYVRPVDSFASPSAGKVIDLNDYIESKDAGQVRSSIVAPAVGTAADDYVYFTSKGTGAQAYLLRIIRGSLASASPDVKYVEVENAQTSVSTPVISNNNILYVGASDYNKETFAQYGSVQAFTPTGAGPAWLDYIYGSGDTPSSGDPVQSSPVVYSVVTGPNRSDYIYFTTNSEAGSGFCYSYRITTGAVANVWTRPGTSSNRYALQGFAADRAANSSGDIVTYLVYGDDGNYLYIIQ
jgi:hypothetical protein